MDDKNENIEYLNDILEEHFKIVVAKSGRQAITYLNTHQPDLIWMDVIMTDVDGINTSKIIRSKISKIIPIIFVSSFAKQELIDQCKELDVQDYIIKPSTPEHILERIEGV